MPGLLAAAAALSLSLAAAFAPSGPHRLPFRAPLAERAGAQRGGLARRNLVDEDRYYDEGPRGGGGGGGGRPPRRRPPVLPPSLSVPLIAGVFVLGIGAGVTLDSAINTNPKDLASRDAIDQNAPNKSLCVQYVCFYAAAAVAAATTPT